MCPSLSVGSTTVTRWHPWRTLRGLPHITCETDVDLPDDTIALAYFTSDRIEIGKGLLQSERRSALTHELIHLERGPVAPAYAELEERTVDDEAARRLISVDALIDALLWSSNEAELAEELWVGEDMIRVRLAGLYPDEKDLIEDRLRAKEESA